MSLNDLFSMSKDYRPSADKMTNQELAEEYYKLTGSLVEMPTNPDLATWWRFRTELMGKIRKERLKQRDW